MSLVYLKKISLKIYFLFFLLSIFFLGLLVYFLKKNNSSILTPYSNIDSVSFLTISPTPEPTLPIEVHIGLVGDLGLGRHITSISRSKNDFSWPFAGIYGWLSSKDFTLANLESPIIKSCPTGKTGTFTFCGDDQFLPLLKKYNFVLNLNNNHILNYGNDGLIQTKKYLTDDYFYEDLYIKEVEGIKFGFLGYDFVTYPKTNQSEILKKVGESASQVDWLIISIHWGNEYLPKAEQWRIDFSHDLISAGADIIHGHHPHVWQGMEWYLGKPIIYSFGNFVFDQSWSYETSHSNIADLVVSKNTIKELRLFPIEIRHNSQPWLTN